MVEHLIGMADHPKNLKGWCIRLLQVLAKEIVSSKFFILFVFIYLMFKIDDLQNHDS